MNLGSLLIVFTALCTAIAMAAYLPGVRRTAGNPRLGVARLAVYLSGLGLVLASAHLWHLILTHQFQYDYVYRYSSRDLPVKYLISTFWGGQEGTFLLWALFGGMLSIFLRFKARHYEAPVQFFYLGINLFLLLILMKANPAFGDPQIEHAAYGVRFHIKMYRNIAQGCNLTLCQIALYFTGGHSFSP
jgi:cytochrome c-type biogenesis protein CcmF